MPANNTLMRTCSYCGRENPDGAADCQECGTDLAITPAPKLSAEQWGCLSKWARVASIPFACLACLWLVFIAGGRTDSPEEFDMALRLSFFHAAPVAFASALLSFRVTQRWHLPLRYVSIGVVAILVWILCARFLENAHYSHLRARGIDPEQVLSSLKPESQR